MLAGAIGGDIGHGAGAVERDGGDEVFEPIGAHGAQAVAHALAFELEHPSGVATGQHGVGFGVVEGDFGEVDHHPLPGQQFEGALQDGQRLEAEEVELHQAGVLGPLHIELCRGKVRPRILRERRDLG